MALPASTVDVLPRWITRATTELTGRDPLGLSRVAQLLADGLLPGIITQTDRARYYSLYCWAIWHVDREEQPDSWQAFEDGFQRREAAIALATLIADPSSSPVGKRAVRSQLAKAEPNGEVRTDFRVLPSSRLGGFSQDYGGCLHLLGLTHRTEDGVDRTSEGMGERLAEAAQVVIGATSYVKGKLYSEKKFGLAALKASSRLLSIDAIALPECAEERKALSDVFFGFGDPERWALARDRRASLARILFIHKAYADVGVPVMEKTFDDQVLYAPTYFDRLVNEHGRCFTFDLPDGLRSNTLLWRQYCLHQFVTSGVEGLLDGLLRLLANHPAGLTLDEALSGLTESEFSKYLRKITGAPCTTPFAFLSALKVHRLPGAAERRQARALYGLQQRLNELWLGEQDAARPAQIVARACVLLGLLYGKWRGIDDDAAHRFVVEKAGPEYGAHNVLGFLDPWLGERATWVDALRPLLINIVEQHDRVMYGKGRLESCWIVFRDGRLVKEQEYEPYFRSPRHVQSGQILIDLQLLKRLPGKRPKIGLTSQGETMLKRLLAEG